MDAASQTAAVPRLAEHLFRHEAGRMVSVITGMFGLDRLQLAEDVVQEALVRALQTWPYAGVPENPPAWLMQTAKRLALDVIRREKVFREKELAITATIELRLEESATHRTPRFDDELKDGRLRLMFACCHPLIPPESQTAVALKTLCGFSPEEIAKAYLTTEAAIAKRLVRARQRIQELRIPFEIPTGAELTERLASVWRTLYLLFNEGYKASGGERLVREDLCHEAIRLTKLLADHPAGDHPTTHALLALMLLNAARLEARADEEGHLLRLGEQDRGRWNHELIAWGLQHLRRSAAGAELSEYHLQAGIAACHSAAHDDASTDWPRILALYDQLVEIDDSPVVALNRAIAIANVNGPAAGLTAVEKIPGREKLASYHLLFAVLGEFQFRAGDAIAATKEFQKARALADTTSERAFLDKRLRDCAAKLSR